MQIGSGNIFGSHHTIWAHTMQGPAGFGIHNAIENDMGDMNALCPIFPGERLRQRAQGRFGRSEGAEILALSSP